MSLMCLRRQPIRVIGAAFDEIDSGTRLLIAAALATVTQRIIQQIFRELQKR